jgi:hypothetical protein
MNDSRTRSRPKKTPIPLASEKKRSRDPTHNTKLFRPNNFDTYLRAKYYYTEVYKDET